MPSAVTAAQLKSLDRVIARNQLHLGDAREPVYVTPLLRDVTYWYGLHSEVVLAVTHRWRTGRERFTDILFNAHLRDPNLTAENRHAVAHEWAHIFFRHPSGTFILWRGGTGPDPFAAYLDAYCERQCEHGAAYLLIRPGSLAEMLDAPNDEIARVLDVPTHLVAIRWAIWRKFGR